jgi:methylase of polypeptide subunit release factors
VAVAPGDPELSEVKATDVFVDFGCGKGRVLYLACRHPFKEVIGVDLSPAVVEAARRNLHADGTSESRLPTQPIGRYLAT